MTLWHLVFGEMAHRKLNAVLMSLSVAAAAACAVGSLALLGGHDWRTERIIEQKEAATRKEMARLEDDTRIIMRRMGYNVLILHRDQDVAELHTLGYPTTSMPEEWAERLAQAEVETLNHLLPILQRRVLWPEIDQQVLLTGIRGQVAQNISGRSERSPITHPVPSQAVVLGDVLARRIEASVGSTVTLMGERFRVERVNAHRGTSDDMAVWVELHKAQQWLEMPGRINGILALECVCSADSLGRIQAEIAAILPETQVFEFSSKVRGRAEARQRAAEAHRVAIDAEKTHRTTMRREREQLAVVLVPVIAIGACVGVLLLASANARERRGEIGILRALGLRERQIVSAFLAKAAVTGLLGGAIGSVGGLLLGSLAAGGGLEAGLFAWVAPWQVALALALGPVLGCLSSLPPAVSAARRDPAAVLSEE
jgi:hypothetical protein